MNHLHLLRSTSPTSYLPACFLVAVSMLSPLGCTSLKPAESNRRVVPVMRTEDSHQALAKFATLKTQKCPDTKIIFSRSKISTGGLPAGAPELDPLLEHAFSALAPSGLFFVPPETLPTLIDAAGQGRLPTKYMQADGAAPEVLMLRVSAYLDRAVQNTHEGLTLQGLLMLKNGYVQPEYDMELEKEVSRLTVKILVENPDGHIDPICASLSADLVQQKESSKVALLIFGSGGAYYDHVLVADGLGTSLDSVVSYAVLACCGRALGLPYWTCGFGEADPDALSLGAHRAAEAIERRANAIAAAEAALAAAAANAPASNVPAPSGESVASIPTPSAVTESATTTIDTAAHAPSPSNANRTAIAHTEVAPESAGAVTGPVVAASDEPIESVDSPTIEPSFVSAHEPRTAAFTRTVDDVPASHERSVEPKPTVREAQPLDELPLAPKPSHDVLQRSSRSHRVDVAQKSAARKQGL